MDENKYLSEMDSRRFGFKIAKVDFSDDANDPGEIVSFLKEKEFRLIITKTICEDIPLINRLEKLGFETMDFQVGYDYYVKKDTGSAIKFNSDFPVHAIDPADVEPLVILAGQAFDGFGHYFADKRLDRKLCLEIYKDWTRNVCTNKDFAEIVYAAYDEGRPIGYFAFTERLLNKVPIASGVMGAVASSYNGKGIFQSLLARGVEWAAAKGMVLKDMKVHTTNYPINTAFSKLGFRIGNSCITMHCWL
ncbi:MAG TPA: GNAT family N-acetyltransferase [Bacteroidales bacterium]|nr:GNAT family N-acetyltransferase [Bacteroidales bacterium]HOV12341.1 GNAT family N-acetyltransferase [Bacteroidales bacterium]HQI70720.1 GNAT family N-acetyltransferase [Bacteroidales bacterium]